MLSKIQHAYQLIQKGYFIVLIQEIKKQFYSHSISIGLQRDLSNEFKAPSAKIEIQIRPLKKEDVPKLLNPESTESLNPRIIANQQSMADANIPTCYVAVTEHDKPCYMQWLIGYKDNPVIKNYFKGIFPALKASEALLEGAYSNPDYRGLRIMPMAMSLIAEKASEINARWVNTFVDATNIPSLKGCQRSGFKPYLIRKDRWLLFQLTSTFHPVTESMKQYFYEVTDSKPTNAGNKKEESDAGHPVESINTI